MIIVFVCCFFVLDDVGSCVFITEGAGEKSFSGFVFVFERREKAAIAMQEQQR